MNNSKQSFLTPAGAGIILICFFLPWVNYACAGEVKNYSGADIGGITWIVFAAAIVMLLSHFILATGQKSGLAMPVTLIAAFTGLGVMIAKYIKYADAEKGPVGVVMSIKYGLILTIVGFILAILGAFTARKSKY